MDEVFENEILDCLGGMRDNPKHTPSWSTFRRIVSDLNKAQEECLVLRASLAEESGFQKLLGIQRDKYLEQLAATEKERDASISVMKEHGFACMGGLLDSVKQVVQVAIAEADNASKARQQLSEAQAAIESDRSKFADFVTSLDKILDSSFWLTEGRGSYQWDDDRYRGEFHDAAVELLNVIKPMRRLAADLSNSPRTTKDVILARVDLRHKLAAAEAREKEARVALTGMVRCFTDPDDWEAMAQRWCVEACLDAHKSVEVAKSALSPEPPTAALDRAIAAAKREGAAEELEGEDLFVRLVEQLMVNPSDLQGVTERVFHERAKELREVKHG